MKSFFRKKKPETVVYCRDWQNWCERVLRMVRFQPDHEAIARELMAHMEDGRADLERLGYDRALAEQRTLQAMGDPTEVGRALDQTHKPWLGWLWKATRVLLLALGLMAAVSVFSVTGLPELVQRTRTELLWEPPASAVRAETEHAVIYAAPGEVREENGHITADIDLWIEMRDPLAAGQELQLWYLTCRDDQGSLPYYLALAGRPVRPESRYWKTFGLEDMPGGWRRFRQGLELTLDQPPRWAEITYPNGSADWTLRVEWGKEL